MITDPTGDLSTNAKLTSTYRVRRIVYSVDFNWVKNSTNFNDGTWSNETSAVVRASGSSSLMPLEQRVMGTGITEPAQCSLTLNNSSGRFSPYRTDGALYANIGAGKIFHTPVRIWAGVLVTSGSANGRVDQLIDVPDTTIYIAAGVAAIATGEVLLIDAEQMLVTTGATLSALMTVVVTRGYNGTTITAHFPDTTVYVYAATRIDALQSAISDAQTSITLVTTTWQTGTLLKIESEHLLIITNSGGGNYVVQRGAAGSTPANHNALKLVEVAGALARIFTGVIADTSEQSSAKTVTMTCFDRAHLIGQYQSSTGVYENKTPDQLIGLYLDQLTGISGAPLYLPVSSGQRSFDAGHYLVPNGFLEEESSYTQASLVAAADGGVLWFNSEGIAKFFNAAHWVNAISVYTIDQSNLVMPNAFSVHDDFAGIFNSVNARYAPREPSPLQTIWSGYETVSIPPNGTYETSVKFRYPCRSVVTPVANTDFFAASGGGMDLTANVTVTTFTVYALHANITLTNDSAQQAFLSKFQVRGIPLLGATTQAVAETRTTSPTGITPRDLTLPENYYRQQRAQVEGLCSQLADRVKIVRATYTLSIVGNPLLELGDLITINESIALSANRTALITALTWQLSAREGFIQTMTASDFENHYPASAYFIVGTTALAAGVAWY